MNVLHMIFLGLPICSFAFMSDGIIRMVKEMIKDYKDVKDWCQ